MSQLQPDLEDLRKRIQRLRRRNLLRRGIGGTLVIGILFLGIVVPLAVLRPISGGSDNSSGATGISPTATPSPETELFSDPDDGISIQGPSDWFFDANPVPNLLSPPVLFGLGSWAFPVAQDCGPNEALASLPADGVFIWIIEYANSEVGPEVAGMFESSLQDAAFSDELVQPECAGAAPSYVLHFKEGPRLFEVHAAFGSLATNEVKETALSVIKTINLQEPI